MEDEELISTILYRGEGPALDLKRSQYPFANATDDEKSELLKDILAFANAWRSEIAYIIIGVTERPIEVVGLDTEIDDARVQQFVNAKTNRPVEFSYREAGFRGKRVGIYAIAVQSRPSFIRKAYGKVAANTVYVRRGSSTAIADPDEIAKMGSASTELPALPEIVWRVRDWSGTEDPDSRLIGHYKHRTFPVRAGLAWRRSLTSLTTNPSGLSTQFQVQGGTSIASLRTISGLQQGASDCALRLRTLAKRLPTISAYQ